MKQPAKKKATVTNNIGKKKLTMKTKAGGKATVGKKFVSAAKTKTGVFKPIKYKGSSLKNKAGKYVGYKSQSGKVHKTTTGTVNEQQALKKAEKRDKAVHTAQQKKRAATAKRASKAK